MPITFNHFQVFVTGACIGSFINVVVYRLPNNLSIVKPRSFCPKCQTSLSLKENIPLISWLIQRGKCKNCNTQISVNYPLIEFLTGILFVVLIYSTPTLFVSNNNFFIQKLFSWLFLSLLLCITFIDINNFWIPQSLVNFGFMTGLTMLIFVSSSKGQFIDFFYIIKGMTSSLTSFFIFESIRYLSKYIMKRDALGQGDSKLVAMIALWLGPMGTLFMVGISYIFAAIFCFFGLFMKFLRLRQAIPFAPFLSLGGLVVWFLGNEFIMEKFFRI